MARMKARVLPRFEWPRLAGTEAETIWPILDPQRTAIVVVENEQGEIVGCHVLTLLLHAECLWIREDHRGKGSVARRLWAEVCYQARALFGARSLMTAAMDDRIRELLAHVGASQIPGDHFRIPLRDR